MNKKREMSNENEKWSKNQLEEFMMAVNMGYSVNSIVK